METDNIICPFCHKEFPLVEAISEKQRAWLEKEFFARHEKQYEEEKKELKKALTEKIRKDMDSEIKEKEEEIENKSKELEAYKNQKRQLLKKERELEEARSAMALEIEERIAEERKNSSDIRQKQVKDFELKIKEKEKVIEDLNKQMKLAQQKAEQGSMKLQGEILELNLEEILIKEFPEDEIKPIAPGKKGAGSIQDT